MIDAMRSRCDPTKPKDWALKIRAWPAALLGASGHRKETRGNPRPCPFHRTHWGFFCLCFWPAASLLLGGITALMSTDILALKHKTTSVPNMLKALETCRAHCFG